MDAQILNDFYTILQKTNAVKRRVAASRAYYENICLSYE